MSEDKPHMSIPSTRDTIPEQPVRAFPTPASVLPTSLPRKVALGIVIVFLLGLVLSTVVHAFNLF